MKNQGENSRNIITGQIRKISIRTNPDAQNEITLFESKMTITIDENLKNLIRSS
jgi:hypothetical protein